MTKVVVGRKLDNPSADILLDFTKNLVTGEKDFRSHFGVPTSLEADLLRLGAAIFATDRACGRGEREHYARRLDLTIPIVNMGTLLPVSRQIERVLRKLSNDDWALTFEQMDGSAQPTAVGAAATGRTLLFSGGLDSLAGALVLQDAHTSFQLVSHVTRSRAVRVAQDQLLEAVRSRGSVDHFRFVVSSKDGPPLSVSHDAEGSQRTRSFMFLLLAALTGVRRGFHELVVIAENGPLAIHIPLTAARTGAYSTHTAHPEVLRLMAGILTNIFGTPIAIDNPFVSMTKGEVVRIVKDRIPDSIPLSTSCWKASRLSAGVTHCGECVPCLIRRVAIESCGSDSTTYARSLLELDVRGLGPDDTGRRNIVDLAEFVVTITKSSDEQVLNSWPSLYSGAVDAGKAIAMYRRFAGEAITILKKYPGVAPLLS